MPTVRRLVRALPGEMLPVRTLRWTPR